MHISNDRYFRDRQRHDLALRMIRHEARTCTIRACTALTDDRIRRLCKTLARYQARQQANLKVRRRRGKSPRQIAFFTRNVLVQFESSFLTGVFAAFGLLRPRTAAGEDSSLEFGQLFCDAYETHLQLLRTTRISFEHAWFLLQLLVRGGTLQLARCRHCYSRYLRDAFNVARRTCPICELKVAGVSHLTGNAGVAAAIAVPTG
jgi:hypothetical protein